jgi:hypothetical protein
LSVCSLQLALREGKTSIDNDSCSTKRVYIRREIAQYIFFPFASPAAAEPGYFPKLRNQLKTIQQSFQSCPRVCTQQPGPKEATQKLKEAKTCG